MKLFQVILLPFLFICVGKSNGQCKDELIESLKVTRGLELQSGKTAYMQLNIKNIRRNDGVDQSIDIEVFRREDQLIYKTKDIKIYKDLENSFMVIHPLKRIVWQESDGKFQEDKSMEIIDLQLKLVEESVLLSCKEVLVNDNPLRELLLEPSDQIKDVFGVTELKIVFDRELNQVKSVNSKYMKGKDLLSQIIEFKELNYNYKGKMPRDIKKLIFTTDGRLVDSLKDYTLLKN